MAPVHRGNPRLLEMRGPIDRHRHRHRRRHRPQLLRVRPRYLLSANFRAPCGELGLVLTQFGLVPAHFGFVLMQGSLPLGKLGFPLLQPPITIAKLGVAMAEFGVFLDVSN